MDRELLPHLAIAFPVANVRNEHGDLHDIPQAGPAAFEDAAHVLEDTTGLGTDIVRSDELTVLVEGELTGNIDGVSDPPAMSVTGPRIGHVRRLDCRA